MKKRPLHQQWLDRARSNLERARMDKFSRYILYEDMCFDCQQSVEKALKALMVSKNIQFEWTHQIGVLIKTLEDNQIEVPDNIKKSASLSVYAVRTRYPGDEDPVAKDEFQEAFNLADSVFDWVEKKLIEVGEAEQEKGKGERLEETEGTKVEKETES
jgi:HEPN domain-containing protein